PLERPSDDGGGAGGGLGRRPEPAAAPRLSGGAERPGGAAGAGARGRHPGGAGGGALPDRAGAARRGGAPRVGDDRAGRGGAAGAGLGPGGRAGGAGRDRADRPAGDVGDARHRVRAARGRGRRAGAAAGGAGPARAGGADDGGGPAVAAVGGGRGRPAAGGRRPGRLPHGPGGADQQLAARGPGRERRGDGAAPVVRAGRAGGGRRARRGRGARGGGSGGGRGQRAGGALWWNSERRPEIGGRFRGAGQIPVEGRIMTIRVLLVDDQPLLRTGFRLILEAEPDITVVGQAGDGHAAQEQTRALLPDVVLMDIRMPGVDGIEATRRIVRDAPRLAASAHVPKVLVLTTFDLDEYIVEALRSGASGFLLKDVPPDELVQAIRVVAAGEAIVAPSVTRRLLDRFAAR